MSNSLIRFRLVKRSKICVMENVTEYGHHPECRVTFEGGGVILFDKISVPTIELPYKRSQYFLTKNIRK